MYLYDNSIIKIVKKQGQRYFASDKLYLLQQCNTRERETQIIPWHLVVTAFNNGRKCRAWE